jgi:hypothetical protein
MTAADAVGSTPVIRRHSGAWLKIMPIAPIRT